MTFNMKMTKVTRDRLKAGLPLKRKHAYLNEEDRRGEDERHGPRCQHRLLRPAQGAEVLRLQGVHDGVVSVQEREINY